MKTFNLPERANEFPGFDLLDPGQRIELLLLWEKTPPEQRASLIENHEKVSELCGQILRGVGLPTNEDLSLPTADEVLFALGENTPLGAFGIPQHMWDQCTDKQRDRYLAEIAAMSEKDRADFTGSLRAGAVAANRAYPNTPEPTRSEALAAASLESGSTVIGTHIALFRQLSSSGHPMFPAH